MHDDILSHFASAIRGEAGLPEGLAICPNHPVSSALAIYRNNYRGNLQGALAGAYPVLGQIVGEKFFSMMARDYIESHPSRSGNLHRYGAQFGDFICNYASSWELPYLSDMARLEWACHLAYFVEDAPQFDIAGLAQVAPDHYEHLRLSVNPACSIQKSAYPVAAIWNAHQPGMPDDFSIDLGSGPDTVLVGRRDGVVSVRKLEAAAADWIMHIQSGMALGCATESTQRIHPGFDLTGTLLECVAQGELTGFGSMAL